MANLQTPLSSNHGERGDGRKGLNRFLLIVDTSARLRDLDVEQLHFNLERESRAPADARRKKLPMKEVDIKVCRNIFAVQKKTHST